MPPVAPYRVRLRYAAFDAFIEKFAPNVTRGGVFLASRTPRPVGEVFPFEIQLAGGEVALAGEGKVTWVKPFDAANPQRPHGMGVQFLRLDAPSRDLLNRILARKAATGGGVRPAVAASPGGHRPGMNGTVAPARVPPVDTNVDLAAELGIDEAHLRRVTDRYWRGPNRSQVDVDELDALLKPEPAAEPVTVSQALAELPRLLDRSRRMTGAFRILGAAAAAAPAAPLAMNGTAEHDVRPAEAGDPTRDEAAS